MALVPFRTGLVWSWRGRYGDKLAVKSGPAQSLFDGTG